MTQALSVQTDQAHQAENAPQTLNVVAYVKEPERSTMRFERLAERFPTVNVTVASTLNEAAASLGAADALITIGNHLGDDAGAIYRSAPKLKWIQSFGTGVDNMKGHADLPSSVAVTNVHGVHGPQLSEAAFAAMLAFSRKIPDQLASQADAAWTRRIPTLLHGSTACIVGLGAIADAVAPRCKAFGMRVTGVTRTPRDLPHFDQVFRQEDLSIAAAECDYLIVLVPYSADTRHLINEQVLRAMRPSAIVINLSRGGVVDEDALLSALNERWIGGAALDVFETEPLPAHHPFWRHPRILITPHTAGIHAGYPDQAYEIIAANVARYLSHGAAGLMNKA